MARKKSEKKEKAFAVTLHIYGIYDSLTKTVVYVSLDLEETEMELALKDQRYCRCEFDTTLFL